MWFIISLLLSLPLSATESGATPSDGDWPAIDSPLRTNAQATHDAAVVIGIQDYLDLPPVPFAERDSTVFRDTLVNTVGIPTGSVRLLTGKVDKAQIVAAVQDATHFVGAGGTLWVYFAGHGVASPDPKRPDHLLLGVNTLSTTDSFLANGFSVSDLAALTSTGGAKPILILDTCYTGVSRDGASLTGGTRYAVPQTAIQSDKAVLWNAAAPGEQSQAFASRQQGAFTYFLIGSMRGWADGVLDGQRDGTVTFAEAQQYISLSLPDASIRGQHPALVDPDASTRVLAQGVEPSPQLRRAIDQVRQSADAEWGQTQERVQRGGEVGKAALRDFIDHYEGARAQAIGVESPVEISLVSDARRQLQELDARSAPISRHGLRTVSLVSGATAVGLGIASVITHQVYIAADPGDASIDGLYTLNQVAGFGGIGMGVLAGGFAIGAAIGGQW